MHFLFVRHHLLPGEFFKRSRGERIFLLASAEVEVEAEEKARKAVDRQQKKRK